MEANVGDLGERMAKKLSDDTKKKIQDLSDPETEAHRVMRKEGRGNLFGRISFEWRESDHIILEQIRAAAWAATIELFDDAFGIIDDIYFHMRIPKADPKTGVVITEDGRPVWETDENGRIIEDFSQLTGQDIETALLDLMRLSLQIAPRINGLLMEALFAKHIADDIRDDAYLNVVDDTIPGRTARSNQKSRVDRYHALFRFWMYSNSDVLAKEVENLRRTLDRIAERQVRSQPR